MDQKSRDSINLLVGLILGKGATYRHQVPVKYMLTRFGLKPKGHAESVYQ